MLDEVHLVDLTFRDRSADDVDRLDVAVVVPAALPVPELVADGRDPARVRRGADATGEKRQRTRLRRARSRPASQRRGEAVAEVDVGDDAAPPPERREVVLQRLEGVLGLVQLEHRPSLAGLPAGSERQEISARRADAVAFAVALVELDERLVERLAALRLELSDQRDHRRRGAREELPELFSGRGVDPQRSVDELQLEVLAEHVLDVVLSPPLGCLATLERLLGEAPIELTELRVRLPGREAEPAAGARDAR